jgi:hypothetical protein
MVRVMGIVDSKANTMNPENIATYAWKLFDEPKDKQSFEVEVV